MSAQSLLMGMQSLSNGCAEPFAGHAKPFNGCAEPFAGHAEPSTGCAEPFNEFGIQLTSFSTCMPIE